MNTLVNNLFTIRRVCSTRTSIFLIEIRGMLLLLFWCSKLNWMKNSSLLNDFSSNPPLTSMCMDGRNFSWILKRNYRSLLSAYLFGCLVDNDSSSLHALQHQPIRFFWQLNSLWGEFVITYCWGLAPLIN